MTTDAIYRNVLVYDDHSWLIKETVYKLNRKFRAVEITDRVVTRVCVSSWTMQMLIQSNPSEHIHSTAMGVHRYGAYLWTADVIIDESVPFGAAMLPQFEELGIDDPFGDV